MRRKSHRRRRTDHVSESVITVGQMLDLTATGGDFGDGSTKTASVVWNGVDNLGTTNRKIVRVTGDLCFTAALSADQAAVAMFALWAHPTAVTPAEGLLDFDPFDIADNPQAGKEAYDGRPTPRPFGRRMFALNVPKSGSVQTFTENFTYRTRAKRLVRPGWELHGALWARASNNAEIRLTGFLRAVVEG